jgi:hypothetical protein
MKNIDIIKQRAHIIARVLLPSLYFIHHIPFVAIESNHLQRAFQGSLMFAGMSVAVFPVPSDTIHLVLLLWTMSIRMLATHQVHADVRYALVTSFAMDVCVPFMIMQSYYHTVASMQKTKQKYVCMEEIPRVGGSEVITTYRDIDIKQFLMLCFLASQSPQIRQSSYVQDQDHSVPVPEPVNVMDKRRIRRMACSYDDMCFQHITNHQSHRTLLVA